MRLGIVGGACHVGSEAPARRHRPRVHNLSREKRLERAGAEGAYRAGDNARHADTNGGPHLYALLTWILCATALGLIEISIVGAKPGMDFSSYSLLRFMLYYWVPSALGGVLVWIGLAVADRATGKRHNRVAWGVGLFTAAAVFVYVGLEINMMLKGSPFTPVGIGANLAVAAGAAGLGFLAGAAARRLVGALSGRRAAATALAVAASLPFVYLAWSWGNIHPGGGGARAGTMKAGAPNVILLTIDACRADHLSLNGYSRPTTPYLTRMASEGANFTLALSQATITVRSMTSLFTSLYPKMHGVMNSELRVSDTIPTLPEVLSRAGYVTAGFGGGNPSLYRSAGIVRGYDYYDDCRSIWALVPQKVLSRLSLVQRMDIGSARMTPTAETIFNKVRCWLDHDPGRPFFMFIHLMDVHAPYLPPDGYADMFGRPSEGVPSDVRLNRKANALVVGKSEMFFDLVEAGEFDRMDEMNITNREVSAADLKRLIELYDGSIAYADSQIGKFMDDLSERGVLENTLVIITADHGEGFLDHGRLFHSGDLVYDELMRVPLVMRCPKIIPAGTSVGEQVRLIDVMPTVLDVTGVYDAGAAGDSLRLDLDMQGRSLVPLLLGDPEEVARRRDGDVYCEGALVSCVRTPHWKYIDSPGHDTLELYDLINDPRERTNLFDDRVEVAGRMAERLEWYEALVRRYRDEHPGPTRITVDTETRQRLRALGYVE
jgi:choline-sulfatase